MADQLDFASRVMDALNNYLVGGAGCPGSDSFGECAAMDFDEAHGQWLAHCSWWPEEAPDSTRLAEIVHAEGGRNVWVFHHLYSDVNEDRNGRDPFGVQSLDIQFEEPEAAHG